MNLLLPVILLTIASSSYAQPWFVDRDHDEEARVRAAKLKQVEITYERLGVDRLREPGTQQSVAAYDSLGRKTRFTSWQQRISSIESALRPKITSMHETRYHYSESGDLAMIESFALDTLTTWTVILYDSLHRQIKRKQYYRGSDLVSIATFQYNGDGYYVRQFQGDEISGKDMMGEINSKGRFRYVHVIDHAGRPTYSYINTYYEDSATLKEQRVGADSTWTITFFDRDGRAIGTRDVDGNETRLECSTATQRGLEIRECKRIYNGGWSAGRVLEHRDPHGNVIFSEHIHQEPHGRDRPTRRGSRMRLNVVERYP